jgi:putative ABC transport system permease protein
MIQRIMETNALSDLKHALLALYKSPGFTLIAVLTLSLGIGATTAIFSVLNAVLLRPLPYAQPEQLVRLYSEFPTFADGGLRRFQLAYPEYVELRDAATSWESIDLWLTTGVNLDAGTPTRANASFITGGMMQSLGAQPVLGRTITRQDAEPGAPPVAVISYELWQRTFGGEQSIIGRDVRLSGLKVTIIGVLGEDFRLPPGELDPSELWIPLHVDLGNPGIPTERLLERGTHVFDAIGRLKPGVTLRQARAEIDSLVAHWGKTTSGHRFSPSQHTLVAYELREEVVRGVKSGLVMLMAAVSFLLLISCVNVANLLLARAETRQRETAIRSALGAGNWRLTAQFMSEGFVLAGLGAVIGIVLAYIGVALFRVASAASIPRAMEIGIDGRTILFTIGISLVTCVVFGLTPLFHILRRDLHASMKSAGAATTDSVGTQRFRQGLIVCQLALALVLLMGTGLMLRALWKLQDVDPGFNPQAVTSMFVALPVTETSEGIRAFWSRLDERLQTVPGIESAAMTIVLPPVYPPGAMDTQIEGFVPTSTAPEQNVDHYNVVTAGYFKTLQLRMLEGRVFDSRDDAQSPRVAVINQSMARTFWPNQSPIGRRVKPGLATQWYTIVGVVADAKNEGLDRPAGTELFLSHLQIPERAELMAAAYILFRSPPETAGNVSLALNAIRREVTAIDPSLPITRVMSMEEVLSAAQSRPRLLTLLLTLFAVVALTLAAVGIYGVIAYSVAQRTRELGLRIALGAQPADVLRLVLKRGVMLTVCGIALGLMGAWGLTRFLSGLLYGVTATDPVTFVGVTLLLGAIAVLASYLPARAATKADPMIALRTE